MILNNYFRLLSVYGGPEWTLSSAADTIKFWKASESDTILVVSRSYVWFGWLKANEFEFCHKDAKSVVCDGKCDFLYTAIVRTGSQRN